MRFLKSIATKGVIAVLVIAVSPLAFSCPTRIGTNRLGDGRMYTCYLSGEDADYCYYSCYSV